MYQLSCKAKTFWTALSCALNRVYFQYLQCPWTVLFTLSPRPYSNLSSYFFCFSDFYSRTISTLNQQVKQAFLYNIHAYLLRIHPPPSTGEAMAAMDQRLPCSSTTEAKSRWTTSGSVGPKMASPKISPPGTGWGDPVVTGMIWRFDSCEMHFFVCAWMSHVYHCLDFLMLLCNSLGRLSVIPTKWNCVSFVKSIGGAESFSVTAHGFPRSVPWCE